MGGGVGGASAGGVGGASVGGVPSGIGGIGSVGAAGVPPGVGTAAQAAAAQAASAAAEAAAAEASDVPSSPPPPPPALGIGFAGVGFGSFQPARPRRVREFIAQESPAPMPSFPAAQSSLDRFASQLDQIAAQLPEVGAAIRFKQENPLSEQNIGRFVGRTIGEEINRFVAQPSTGPVPLAPLVGSQYCPECDPQGRALVHQRGDVQRSIQLEQSQQLQKQIQAQQRQISQIQSQEGRDLASRDIAQEIAQKRALLEQIDSELSELQSRQSSSQSSSQFSSQSSSQSSVFEAHSPAMQGTINSQQTAISRTLTQEEKAVTAVTFCVGCESQNDAFRFLNGEPSACSVMPFIQQGGM